MVGIVNRPHTRRMALLRTITSRALFQFPLSHCVPLFDFKTLSETAVASSNPLMVCAKLELIEILTTDAVCFVAMFPTAPGSLEYNFSAAHILCHTEHAH